VCGEWGGGGVWWGGGLRGLLVFLLVVCRGEGGFGCLESVGFCEGAWGSGGVFGGCTAQVNAEEKRGR